MIDVMGQFQVYGIGKQVAAYDVQAGGQHTDHNWSIQKDDGSSVAPLMVFGVSSKIYAIVSSPLDIMEELSYTIVGAVVPVYLTIHFSALAKDVQATDKALEGTEFATQTPDPETGVFKQEVSGKDGVLYCWTKVENSTLDLLNGGIKISSSAVPAVPAVPASQPYRFTDINLPKRTTWTTRDEETQKETTHTSQFDTFTITGTCPESAEKIYVSRYREGICTHCEGTKTEWIICPTCGGTGKVEDNRDCPQCKTKKFISGGECVRCNGTGHQEIEPLSSELLLETVAQGTQIAETPGNYKVTGKTDAYLDISYVDKPNYSGYYDPGYYLVDPYDSRHDVTKPYVTPQLYNYYLTVIDRQVPSAESLPTENLSYYDQYRVWCFGEEGEITASMDSQPQEAGVCLSGDTLITLADGGYKELQFLVVGDLVLSADHTPTPVTQLIRNLYNSYHTLYTFSDGTIINEIKVHRFYNTDQGFWQYLKDWKIGEHALREDGEKVALVSKTQINEPAECFGIWTESHTYFANKLLSGETAANQSLLSTVTPDVAAEILNSLPEDTFDTLLKMEKFS